MSYFPKGTPESQGIDSNGLITFIKEIRRKGLELHRLMIVRHGVCVAKGCADPYTEEQLHPVYSFSKSLTSTAIGFAEKEGKLRLDEKLVDIFPEEMPEEISENLGKCTIRHLLNMTCGHETEITSLENDWLKKFFAHPFVYEPGTFYLYNTAGTNVLSAIIKKKTGEDLITYLTPRLLNPLQMKKISCAMLPDGTAHGGGGMKLCLEDMAKFTYFMLLHGCWEGKELLPGWYEKMGSKQMETKGDSYGHIKDWACGYGYQCWIGMQPGSFRADGAFGQFGLVYPELDLIVITNMATEMTQTFMDIVNEQLIPSVKTGEEEIRYKSMKECDTGAKKLNHILSSMKIHPLLGCRNPMMEKVLQEDMYYALDEISNPVSSLEELIGGAGLFDVKHKEGIWKIGFEFREDDVMITFWDEKEKCVRASLAGKFDCFEIDDLCYAATARWRGHDTLELEIRRMDAMSGVRMLIRIMDDELHFLMDETLMTDGGLGMIPKYMPVFIKK